MQATKQVDMRKSAIAHKPGRKNCSNRWQYYCENFASVASVSNVLLLFVDAFDLLSDKITQTISIGLRLTYMSVIEFSILTLNFVVIFWTVIKISQIYCWGILVRVNLHIGYTIAVLCLQLYWWIKYYTKPTTSARIAANQWRSRRTYVVPSGSSIF